MERFIENDQSVEIYACFCMMRNQSRRGWEMVRFIVSIVLVLVTTLSAGAGTLKWGGGWSETNEQINFSDSYVSYDYFKSSRFLRVTYYLSGAKPKKLHQVGMHFYCTTPIQKFGQFSANAKSCVSYTLGGVTKSVDSFEFGVILTDIDGNGSFEVNIGPLNPGVYKIQFTARLDAGCYMSGYPSPYQKCSVVFSAPGKFGNSISLIVK